MSATSVLIHLLGEIALLLWGINMVNSGVQRAFGSDLRWFLGVGLRTRLRAFLAGVGVTTVLSADDRAVRRIPSTGPQYPRRQARRSPAGSRLQDLEGRGLPTTILGRA